MLEALDLLEVRRFLHKGSGELIGTWEFYLVGSGYCLCATGSVSLGFCLCLWLALYLLLQGEPLGQGLFFFVKGDFPCAQDSSDAARAFSAVQMGAILLLEKENLLNV